ncbi:MAG: sulfotransferase, partial [Planctomycetota bacterium]
KLVEPVPPRGADRRLAQARRRTRRMQWLSGRRLDAQHLMRAELPDECGHLFRPAFLSPDFAVAPALRYLRLYPDHDARPAYLEYRALLALLAGDDARRLVLKDPFHALFHDALDEALPGAMVVQLHRDPREVVPSFVKLCTSAQRLVSRRRDLPTVARAIQDWLGTVAERSVARANDGRHDVLDLDYRRFVADPVQTVEDIHRHFDLPFEPSWRDQLHPLLASGRPKNPYSMDALGLDPDHLDRTFAPYVRRFLEP